MGVTIVYHYTDTQAFKGVVEKAELWATDFRYLNDPASSSTRGPRSWRSWTSSPNSRAITRRPIGHSPASPLFDPAICDNDSHERGGRSV
ncbi:hypothetical protein MPRM_02600 [Mycobacterium parmense]|uniref:Uncharacterized protein n=1 Tax=Mycobacterium parmense TaxID=185642 RepID=A0A7I7YMS8_9MYCO|nr:hypothetical protein MPRM_02600 [Mycobacterium parmense]